MFIKKTQLFALNVEANMITNLTPTDIESLRIAIAEECGWCPVNQSCYSVHCVQEYCNGNHPSPLPPYTTSLDAIQAAAMERFKDGDSRIGFQVALDALIVNCFQGNRDASFWQLTALDWCIAFARTAKIWRYKL